MAMEVVMASATAMAAMAGVMAMAMEGMTATGTGAGMVTARVMEGTTAMRCQRRQWTVQG